MNPNSGASLLLSSKNDKFDSLLAASSILGERLKHFSTTGDAFECHNMHLNTVYRPCTKIVSQYAKTPAMNGNAIIGTGSNTWQFEIKDDFGHFLSDMAVHVRFDSIGTLGATASAATPYYQYCSNVGLRLFRKVTFKSKSFEFSSYTSDDAVFEYKFFVEESEKKSYDKCIGQQELKEANFFGGNYTGSIHYRDGAQTPKVYQPALDLIVPLNFDNCQDIKNALLLDMIHNDNEKNVIEIEVAPIEDIIRALIPDAEYPDDEELEEIALPITSARMSMTLYTNHIFVEDSVMSVIKQESMVKTFRSRVHQKYGIGDSSGSLLLNKFKQPVEYLMVGCRSKSNRNNEFEQWWLMGAPRRNEYANKIYASFPSWDETLGGVQIRARECREFSSISKCLENLSITSRGVPLYPEETLTMFFNAYLPIRYRHNTVIRSPVDSNVALIPFCSYPGTSDTSGYLNASDEREVYLHYNVTAETEAEMLDKYQFEMVISGSVINFLIEHDAHWSLKYT